jgi:hypothetical protein
MPDGEWNKIQDALDGTVLRWLREKVGDPDLTVKLAGIGHQGKYSIAVTTNGAVKHFTLKMRAHSRDGLAVCLAKFLEKVVFYYRGVAA